MENKALLKKLKNRKIIYLLYAMVIVLVGIVFLCVSGFAFEFRTGIWIGAGISAVGLVFVAFTGRIKLRMVHTHEQDIIFYKFFYSILYIDGKEADKCFFLNTKKLSLEGSLNDGVLVQVCISAAFVRMIFSDDTPPICL